MAQVDQGLRSLLGIPLLYRTFQWLVGAPRLRSFLLRRLDLRPGMRLLDVGCGPADILELMPPVEYVGLDLSPHYITAARRRFGSRGRFIQQELSAHSRLELGHFDRILAVGLLHHLDDPAAQGLLGQALSSLTPQGFLLTIDACYSSDQSRWARWLVSRDRGQNVRQPQEYRELAQGLAAEIKLEVHHNLLNIPYSHTLLRLSAAAKEVATPS